MATRCLSLEHEILNVFEEQKESSRPDHFLSLSNFRFCRECRKATDIVHDASSGDAICKRCGIVVNDHKVVDTPYGRGLGGYSTGSTDSLKLDLLTGAKAHENGNTRIYYKTLLKRRANEEIDGLARDENVRELAKLMFERFTDRMEKVRDREKIIEACIAAAESRTRRLAKQGTEVPQFVCIECGMVFNCKKNRRFHTCVKEVKRKADLREGPKRKIRVA